MAAPVVLGVLLVGGLGYAAFRRWGRFLSPKAPERAPAPAPKIAPVTRPPVAPPKGPAADQVGHALKDAWTKGLVDNVVWVPLQIGPFTLEVAAEALSIQGVRVPASMNDAIDVLSSFGGILPTKEIADAMWAQASRKLTPAPLPAGPDMASWEYTRRWNEAIGPLGADLAAGGWKHWILASPMGAKGAVNYGLWRPDGTVWQPPGRQHDPSHIDYSQLIQPVRVKADAGGTTIDLLDWLSQSHAAGEIPGSSGRELGGPIASNVLNRFRGGTS